MADGDASGSASPGPAATQDATFGDFGRSSVGAQADAPMLSLGDEQFVVDAQEELTLRCMQEASLPYAPIRQRAHDPLRRLGPLPPALLRQHGYRDALPPDLADSPMVLRTADLFDGPTNDELIASLSPNEATRWYDTLFGADGSPSVGLQLPDGGTNWFALDSCYSQAITQLFGSMQAFINYEVGGMFMQRETVAALHRLPEFQEAHERWRDCLAAAGWELPALDAADLDLTRSYPERLAEGFYRALPVEEADQRHRQLAETDAACQEQTGFDAVADRAASAALSTASAEFGYDLLGRQELLLEAVRNARGLLGAGT